MKFACRDKEVETFSCPRCGTTASPVNSWAWARLQQEGRCQGCRAEDTLRRRPQTLSMFLSFWMKAGYPSSSSWLKSVGLGSEVQSWLADAN
jgi:hypothetical protein